ncbi:MAG TPA: DUF952 domain-containing protein, partial [Anaerolineaceae bacterium]|nr:DUF952 domain-containing protein [Anaerolineaceae bacterium]
MAIIYHISSREEWERSKQSPEYIDPSLEKEGFIHCSLAEQIPAVAARYYRGRTDLVLMEIDEAKVVPEVRYEALAGTEAYPH